MSQRALPEQTRILHSEFTSEPPTEDRLCVEGGRRGGGGQFCFCFEGRRNYSMFCILRGIIWEGLGVVEIGRKVWSDSFE